MRISFKKMALAMMVIAPTSVIASEKSLDLVTRQEKTTGRFQLFEASMSAGSKEIFMIDSETGRTWIYVVSENRIGWSEQTVYQNVPSSPQPEKNKKE